MRFSGFGAVPPARRFRSLVRSEDGSLTILTLFLIVVMLLAGGAAVDFMRQETARARMQSTLDRAILASASLGQKLDPEAVVRDYFAKAGLKGYHLDVEASDPDSIYRRRVSATVTSQVDSFFLRFVGINQLKVPARGVAEESNDTIEISLVLDVSTSMNSWSGSGKRKIVELREAATEFVTKIIGQTDGARTTISIIPYATQVNVGAALLQQFNYTADHGYSHCVDFAEADFTSAGITVGQLLQQSGHFDRATGSNSAPRQWVCNVENSTRIVPLSGNLDGLKTAIANLNVQSYTGYTSTEAGVKWGAALLMPEAQPAIAGLTLADAATGQRVEERYGDRPLPVAEGARKILVVMTDGDNTDQWFLRRAYTNGPSDVWRNPANGQLLVNPSNKTGLVQQSWPEVWAQMTVSRYAALRGTGTGTYHTVNSNGRKDDNSRAICTAAKDLGVTVYTIGFEIAELSNADRLMGDCATSPAYYFPVRGPGSKLSTAFNSIANDIGKLRLTQ